MNRDRWSVGIVFVAVVALVVLLGLCGLVFLGAAWSGVQGIGMGSRGVMGGCPFCGGTGILSGGRLGIFLTVLLFAGGLAALLGFLAVVGLWWGRRQALPPPEEEE